MNCSESVEDQSLPSKDWRAMTLSERAIQIPPGKGCSERIWIICRRLADRLLEPFRWSFC